MTIDKLVAVLSVTRAKHGNIRVLVHDGSDPSDLKPVKLVEIKIYRPSGKGLDYALAAHLLAG